MEHRWSLVRRETIHRGRVITLHRDLIEGPTGRIEREWVEHPGAVVIVARLGDDVLMVRQYRHATGQALLELPAGTLEPGEDPAATAARELQEECGQRPGRLRPLGQLFAAPGYASEILHFFAADDCTPSSLPADDDEQIEVVRLPLAEARRMARAGELRDTKSALGLLLV